MVQKGTSEGSIVVFGCLMVAFSGVLWSLDCLFIFVSPALLGSCRKARELFARSAVVTPELPELLLDLDGGVSDPFLWLDSDHF